MTGLEVGKKKGALCENVKMGQIYKFGCFDKGMVKNEEKKKGFFSECARYDDYPLCVQVITWSIQQFTSFSRTALCKLGFRCD